MDTILVLDLCTPESNAIFQWLFERMDDGRVVKVSVNQKTKGDYLLIPDTQGYNCTTQAFMPHYKVPPSSIPGQHQWLEHWRVTMCDWYVNKETGLIGIGSFASALIYDTVLKGKLDFDYESGKLMPIRNDRISLVEEDGSFQTSSNGRLQHLGLMSDSIPENLRVFMSHLVRQDTKSPDNEGGQMAFANVPNPPRSGSGNV